jgi:hypothetical protein
MEWIVESASPNHKNQILQLITVEYVTAGLSLSKNAIEIHNSWPAIHELFQVVKNLQCFDKY